jgi:hypothetical protein
MFGDYVPKSIIELSQKQVDKYNFGKRGYADGNKLEQLTGIIGQNTLMALFKVGSVDGELGFDGGYDFIYNNLKIDVKTMGRTVEPKSRYVNNFIAVQTKFSPDAYIFCSYNKKTTYLTVCGWVTKKQFLDRAEWFKAGSTRTRDDKTTITLKADLYEIKNINLNKVSNFKDLKVQLGEVRVDEQGNKVSVSSNTTRKN